MSTLSILFISLMGVSGVMHAQTVTHNPVPPNAILIEDNFGFEWYAEPGLYYDYMILYSDTTADCTQRVVDLYGLRVKRRMFSGKRDISFYIDDNMFSGYMYKSWIYSHEYHTLFPEQ